MSRTYEKTFLATGMAFALLLFTGLANASPIYLNSTNMTIELGPSHDAQVSGNPTYGPFVNVTLANSLANIIDAPSAAAGEFHTQSTHVWATGPLDLVFDLLADYDLTEFHFWNYHSFGYEVGEINLTFFDAAMNEVGTFDAFPHLGGTPNANNSDATEIFAQHFDLTTVLGLADVRYITALLIGGSQAQVDFQNLGFTAMLSDTSTPPPPPPPPTGVPEPATLALIGMGLLGLGAMRRRKDLAPRA